FLGIVVWSTTIHKELYSMSSAFRVSSLSLALSLSIICSVFSLAQSSSSPPTGASSPAESGLRAVVEKYFALYAGKDLDGFLRLWSAQSPELEARRKETQEMFAKSERIEFRGLTIRAVKVDGDNARVRVEVDALVIEAGTGKEKDGYEKTLRTLECV